MRHFEPHYNRLHDRYIFDPHYTRQHDKSIVALCSKMQENDTKKKRKMP